MGKEEVVANLNGIIWLIGKLLYGSGMRVKESLRLRVKDLGLHASADYCSRYQREHGPVHAVTANVD